MQGYSQQDSDEFNKDSKSFLHTFEDEDISSEAVNWRDYFSIDELRKVYDMIIEGEEPTEEEGGGENDSGSDSCPSDDNLNLEDLYNEVYMKRK